MQSASVLQRCLARAAAVLEPARSVLPPRLLLASVRKPIKRCEVFVHVSLDHGLHPAAQPREDAHVFGVWFGCQRAVEQQPSSRQVIAEATAAAD